MRHRKLPHLVCEINKLSPGQLTASRIARLQSHQPSSLKWPPRSAKWVTFGVVQPLRRVLREKVHGRSLSSIHIDYNHLQVLAESMLIRLGESYYSKRVYAKVEKCSQQTGPEPVQTLSVIELLTAIFLSIFFFLTLPLPDHPLLAKAPVRRCRPCHSPLLRTPEILSRAICECRLLSCCRRTRPLLRLAQRCRTTSCSPTHHAAAEHPSIRHCHGCSTQ